MKLQIRKQLKRWIKWLAVGAVALVLLAWALFTPVVQVIIQHEIHVQVAGLLNGELKIDHLSYRAPLTVVITEAHLIATGPGGQPVPVAELGGLDISLARLPLGGPIIIDHLTLTDPVIYLTRLPDGTIQIQPNLLRPQPPSTGPMPSISSLIEFQKLSLSNLTVKVTDLTQPAHPTVQWARLDADAELGGSPSEYHFQAHLADQPLTDLTMAGSVDVDRFSLTFKNLKTTGRLSADSLSQFPPAVRTLLSQNGQLGLTEELTIADGARIDLDTTDNHWKIRSLSGELKFDGKCADQTAAAGVQFTINAGGPLAGPGGLDYLAKLDSDTAATFTIDPNAPLTASSPNLPAPIAQGGGVVQFQNGSLTIDHFAVHCGSQTVDFQKGTGKLQADKLSLDNGVIALAGGTIWINHVDLGLVAPHDFNGDVAFEDIDLKQVKDLLRLYDPKGRLSGSASGKVTASGQLSPTGPINLAAAGKVHAENGDFFDLPGLTEVAQKVNPDFESAGRVGNAAMVFTFDHQTLHLSRLAVSSPVIGVQGDGAVGADPPHTVHLTLVVAPLSGLQSQLDKTPVRFLGHIVGVVQNAITHVSEKALYNFEVTGTAAAPTIRAVPAPALTSEAKSLFDQMVKPGAVNLLDLIQPKSNDQTQESK